MKKLLVLLISLLLVGCSKGEDNRRTLNDAQMLSNNFSNYTVHFTVQANCDYELFFEYEPMINGGFYAYGYEEEQPKLLLIPKVITDDVLQVDWPLDYSIHDAVDLLNTIESDDLIDPNAMYDNVYIELTSNVLNYHFDADYDMPVFVVFNVGNVNYIAFQQHSNLVIYHEGHGLMATSP